MNPTLQKYINGLEKDGSNISTERKKKLTKLSEYTVRQLKNKRLATLTFICTHNSRRSHLCQIWTATLAGYFGLEDIETCSGGTEATALNSRAVEALRRAGFTIDNPGGENPHYQVFYDEEKEPLVCYPKTFDDKANPQEDFVAVMTCSHADRNCPVVPGTAFRVAIPYEDPKQADGTPQEARIYDERYRQIATEMYYMLSRLN